MPETNAIVRSRFTGLKDFYIAGVETNTATEYKTDTPIKLARAIKVKISTKKSGDMVYSDDSVEEVIENFEGIDVELEVNALAPQDRAELYGCLFDNGFLVESSNDVAKEVALGYRKRRLNGKYEFVWLYCGKFAGGDEDNAETEAGKKNPQTETVKGSFYQRQKDSRYRVRIDESNLLEEHADAKTAIAEWFSKVQEYKAVEG